MVKANRDNATGHRRYDIRCVQSSAQANFQCDVVALHFLPIPKSDCRFELEFGGPAQL